MIAVCRETAFLMMSRLHHVFGFLLPLALTSLLLLLRALLRFLGHPLRKRADVPEAAAGYVPMWTMTKPRAKQCR